AVETGCLASAHAGRPWRPDGHPIDARATFVTANSLPRSYEISSVAHLLHQLFCAGRAFGCGLRHGWFGPLVSAAQGFTPAFWAQGQRVAKILVSNLVQGWSNSFEQNSARAERLLLDALERDTSLAKAHATMGQLRRVQNRLIESQFEYETAIA